MLLENAQITSINLLNQLGVRILTTDGKTIKAKNIGKP